MTGVQLYQSNQRQDELNNLVYEYAPLIKRIAEQIKWKIPLGIELDDLIQSGIIGLLEAKEYFAEKHQASFKTYATMKIKYAIFEAIRKHTGISRELSQSIKQISGAINQLEQQSGRLTTTKMVTEKMGISHEAYARVTEEINALKASSLDEIDQEISDQSFQNPFLYAEREQIQALLKATIIDLPKREQLILALYYNEFLGLKEIGSILELTEARVSQIHSQLLSKLKSKLRHLMHASIESN